VQKLETTFPPQSPKKPVSILVIVIVALVIIAGSVGALYYYNAVQSSKQISSLQDSVSTLESQLQGAEKSMIQLENGNGTYPGTNFFTSGSNGSGNAINAVAIYEYANASVVTVTGTQTSFGQTGEVLGSGFSVVYSNSDYIVTNYHVVQGVSGLSVTFSNGDAFAARVVGSDPYSDLAVISVSGAPSSEYRPLEIVPSSNLVVGQSVVAIGNPYGLSGSETTGIISQLGRTIQDETAGNYSIADVIQISTPINPGNSGGPLFNSYGQVVGITTAIVSGSQGLGFAIPSSTILQELPDLITTGSYNLHPYLGIGTADMNYDLAQALGVNYTYGILVESVVPGGPAANAGLVAGSTVITVNGAQYYSGGDIIVSINGTRVINGDSLSTWLQEHGLPGQVVELGVIKPGATTVSTISVTLGTRPPI
jgi:S1-C subfamily serine protease